MKRQADIWRRAAERMHIMNSEEKTVKLLLLHKAMEIENQIRNLKRRPYVFFLSLWDENYQWFKQLLALPFVGSVQNFHSNAIVERNSTIAML